jgi:ElaB/YqjD/DUF883 family membrane-anchored ribosome-binding protein
MMQNTGMQGSTPSGTSAGRYADSVADRASEGLSRLSDSAHQTLERVSGAASGAATRLSERSHELWEKRGEALDTARTYVREHPVASIGIAIAVGLLISRLTSRR